MANCNHSTPQWHLAGCNEDGWKCAECGTLLGSDGFSPQFDREHTSDKVDTILFWLHEHDFTYVSNSDQGASMVAMVVRRCHAENTFDQQSIVKFLIDTDTTHAAFWRGQAKQTMCSHPSRGPCTDSSTLKCHACGHELKIKKDSGPLFASTEPF
jgi:hypothetical protein